CELESAAIIGLKVEASRRRRAAAVWFTEIGEGAGDTRDVKGRADRFACEVAENRALGSAVRGDEQSRVGLVGEVDAGDACVICVRERERPPGRRVVAILPG